MFTTRYTLTRLFGIDIKVDLSWIVVFVLMVWSLSRGVFPFHDGALPHLNFWLMGFTAALGLFVSTLFHELCHAVVARHYRTPIRSITLFIFGGAAELEGEPPSPKAEFLMSIVGPLAGLGFGLSLGQVAEFGRVTGWPVPVSGVLAYVAAINVMVAIFNLLPAFPLDGGRMLRAALWSFKGDIRWATRIASGVGVGWGIVLMVFGLSRLFQGDFIGGFWYFMIGMFLRSAADQSYQHLLMRRTFAGQTVQRLMKHHPVTVPIGTSVRQLVEDYFYHSPFKVLPVVYNGWVVGCVSLAQVHELPRVDWDCYTVARVASPCSQENTVSPDADLLQALSAMNHAQTSTLVVAHAGRVVGMLALRDIMHFLAVKMELEGTDSKFTLATAVPSRSGHRAAPVPA